MKRECKAPDCAERRIHHERPDVPRGPQYVEVPDDYPAHRPVFCSMTCAIMGGYMTLNGTGNDCPKCLVAGHKIEHHSGYVCDQSEVTQEQVDEVKVENARRLAEFKAKYERIGQSNQ